jgi:hypothetical protein
MKTMTTEFTPTELKTRLKALGLFGLIARCDQITDTPWLHEVLAIEERERQKRGLERRMRTRTSALQNPWSTSVGVGQRRSTVRPARSFSA